ncbi:MAG: ISNCY family transposase [Rhabdochlamydiaceae bacterium]|nr:ISNCY family transposase [Rhabdochlamydiaceae bacterium]
MRQMDKKILSVRKASEELGLSLRQTKRIRKRYLSQGEMGLISRHRGKISPNRIDPKLRGAVVKILQREEYAGFGPTFAREKLRQRHGYYLSDETLRKWITEEGLWKAKTKRDRKVYQRRIRRRRFGELLQGDGSRHAWFEERGEECTIVIFVDDATSQLTAGKFVLAETTVAYQEILEEHLDRYGRPLALYVDKHSIFRTSRENSGAKETETHFGRVLRELDIELICAHSPQAKGRVERANGVLQDRLIKEMRLRKISTIEKANEFLPIFIEEYNQKFGKEPINPEDAHRPTREGDDLERIFARRSVRKLSKSLSFQYEGTQYQIQPTLPNRFRPTHVNIIERAGKPILIESGGQEYPYTKWETSAMGKPKVLDSKELEAHWKTPPSKSPRKHHPWRN